MKLGVKLRVARRKSMTYLDKLGNWIKKAASLGSGYTSFGRERVIHGPKGVFHVRPDHRGRKGVRQYSGVKMWAEDGGEGGTGTKKLGRKVYRILGFSKKSLEKAKPAGDRFKHLKDSTTFDKWRIKREKPVKKMVKKPLEKATSLGSRYISVGSRRRVIHGPKGAFLVEPDPRGRKGVRMYSGARMSAEDGGEGVIGKKKLGRMVYRKLGFSTKSLIEKARSKPWVQYPVAESNLRKLRKIEGRPQRERNKEDGYVDDATARAEYFGDSFKKRKSKKIKKAETNGFHAKPGRKVKTKKFIVRGSFKKHGTKSETYTPAGTTSN
jgi:hypothetical protein